MSDVDRLLTWANEARTWSASTATISREEHDHWMMLNVQTGYPTHMVMIAETKFGSVGVVRFDMIDKDVLSYRVSIAIGSEHRGHGYGREALNQACHIMRENTLSADIRTDNVPSRKLFEHCGFVETDRTPDFIRYQREPR